MLQIGITGGIGAGKTVVCNIFSRMGIPVYNADERARELMTSDPVLINKIKEKFGPASYNRNELNRVYLARHVFNDREKLSLLNSLVHPVVGRDYQAWSEKQEAEFLLKEAALLFETGSYRDLDKNILVYASESTRMARILKRDPHRSEKDVEAIMGNQMPEEEKKQLADLILFNDDNSLLLPQALRVFELVRSGYWKR